MSYEQKYLKYKQKYLELKKQLEMNGGAVLSPNDISVNTDSVLNLTTTPNGQTGGFLGMFNSKSKSKPEPSQSPVSVAEPVPETELNLTETPVIESKEVNNNTSLPETNQKIYTEVNLGPEANMKNVVISNKEQSGGGFFGELGSAPAPAPNNNLPCSRTVNSVPVGAVGSGTMEAAAAEQAAEQAAAAAAAAAEQAAAAAAEAAEQAGAAAAEQAAAAAAAAAEQAATSVQAAAEQAAVAAAAEVVTPAAAEVITPVTPVTPVTPGANSKYSVGKSEVNNTEDIERLFSQLGGDFNEGSSESNIFSNEGSSESNIFSGDSSLTLSDSSDLNGL